MLSALYTPVLRAAVASPLDFALVLATFALLKYVKLLPWLAVGLLALTGGVPF